jgi:hypothetical protein
LFDQPRDIPPRSKRFNRKCIRSKLRPHGTNNVESRNTDSSGAAQNGNTARQHRCHVDICA